MLVFNFVFDLLWTHWGSSACSVAFLVSHRQSTVKLFNLLNLLYDGFPVCE